MLNNKRAALCNLGCKVNSYETDAMTELLAAAGCTIVDFEEPADIYIVNTCTVTNIADRKSRQMLHRARRQSPDAVIVACGCYAETWESPDDSVDIAVGNNRKADIVKVLEEYYDSEVRPDNPAACEFDEQLSGHPSYENLSITQTAGHTRAFIKVQDGCNQFCSYCLIPYARGRVRSRDIEEVVSEVSELARNGYREIVITGIHISSYGVDFPDSDVPWLVRLIRAVHDVDGIERVRLGSLEPRIVTEDFIEEMKKLPGLCHHFHLSLQSGCDRTLKAMNRRYSAAEYRTGCEIIRNAWPDAALTTDVITGFPGETEEDFEESYEFVKSINFYETHIFPYSRRRGTRADKMQGQLTDAVKKARSAKLIALNTANKRRFMESFLDKDCEILIEESIVIAGIAYLSGHTREYVHCVILPEMNDNADNSGRECINSLVTGKASGLITDEVSGESFLRLER